MVPDTYPAINPQTGNAIRVRSHEGRREILSY